MRTDKYFGITESNDWEGEEWTLWLPVKGNEEFIAFFKLLNMYDGESGFSLEEQDEEFVNKLCNRRSRTSYFLENQKEDKVIDMDKLMAAIEDGRTDEDGETGESTEEILSGLMYKMQIKDYLK